MQLLDYAKRKSKKTKRKSKRLISSLLSKLFPVRWKEYNELNYWKKMNKEGSLANDFYEYFFTTHYGLDASYYEDKVMLDIGCGPCGSLEWASMASRRIGLDPLAKEYMRLGAKHHRMEYIDAPSEKIPLKDDECDAVSSFNSLDHVEDLDKTLKEIKRITRPGGTFLLLVEVNHPPRACEPHEITPRRLLDSLRPEFVCESLQVYEPVVRGMYQSILEDKKLSSPEETKEKGYLSAQFTRITSSKQK